MFSQDIKQLEEAVLDVLDTDPGRLAVAAKKLSLVFTSERDALADQYFSDADSLDAYIAAFLLPNAVKVMHCLAQIDELGLVQDKGKLNVLDLGTGPGTAILASSLYFSKNHPDMRIRFAGIEQNKVALLKAHELFKKIAPRHHSFESATFLIKEGGLERILKAERFDMILVTNMLNEPAVSAYELCCELISNRLDGRGSFIIIEPALRNNARPLMELRGRLIAEGVACVCAPCLHGQNCPMLGANERDWCHFYIDWNCPQYLSELDRLSAMNHEYLKMSYLILKPKTRGSDSTQEADVWRVVSSPLDSKGKREVFLCGSSGELKRVRRTNKDSAGVNSDFDKVARGDIVHFGGADRIHKNDSFSIIKKWSSF
ncbi:MAG: small ribosomal subunit Rsm22 family protein [Pseudomonadota bacterium]